MDFQELVRKRYSVRAYRADPVPEEMVLKVLEAARMAPTACNKQPVRLVVLRTKGHEAEYARIYHRPWFVAAPVILGVCTVAGEGWVRKDGKNHAEIDGAIVMDHLVLQAADLGLGTCWVCNFDPAAAREVLGLPAGVEPMAFTPLGWPADPPGQKIRRSLQDLESW